MELYTVISIIISLGALMAYIIIKYTRLPTTIGVIMLTMLVSFALIVLGKIIQPVFIENIKKTVASLDFHDLLLNRMLGFLLFAGAIHINAKDLKKERLPIIALATAGTIISTVLVGTLFYFLFILFGHPVPLLYCFLFGSLISPTDPIAVLGILKQAKIPSSLEMKISGESLFNDGVALVIFTLLYEVAVSGADHVTASDVLFMFVKEAGGGLLFGFGLGYISYFLNKSIDNYGVEVLITVAIVMGGYELASYLHISGALAMVVAGIITGGRVKNEVMSDETRDYLEKFWAIVDEILNVILFMLIGLEMLIIPVNSLIIWLGLIGIVIVLIARYLSVAISLFAFKKIVVFEKNAALILTWGGLRGGLSVAMALSLNSTMYKNAFLAITYVIVIFSIVVQGLTIGKVAQRLTA